MKITIVFEAYEKQREMRIPATYSSLFLKDVKLGKEASDEKFVLEAEYGVFADEG